MRLIVSLVLCGCLTSQVAAFQARGATSGTPRISACSLITPDLAATYIHYWYDIPQIEDSITSPPSNIRGHGSNNILTVSVEASL